MTHRPPAPVLRYVDGVASDQSASVGFRFSQSVLTSFDVDVVHVLDRDLDMLLGTTGASPVQRLLATTVFVRNLRRKKIALVRTVDEFAPPGPESRLARRARRKLDDATSAFVAFHEGGATLPSARNVVIPHPTYASRYLGYPRAALIEGRVSCVTAGYIPAAAKNLLAAPRLSRTDGLSIRLAGQATRANMPYLRAAAGRSPESVSVRLELLSDAAQVEEISSAELIALPRVESLEDIQLMHLAFTLDRPVVAPRTPVTARIQAEVGSARLHLTNGPITPADIDTAIGASRSADSSSLVDLSERDIQVTAELFAGLFTTVARKR